MTSVERHPAAGGQNTHSNKKQLVPKNQEEQKQVEPQTSLFGSEVALELTSTNQTNFIYIALFKQIQMQFKVCYKCLKKHGTLWKQKQV